jgi:putative phosphoribosyl transferase
MVRAPIQPNVNPPPFRDRAAAGQMLAQPLGRYAHRPEVLVLGLARGGVPVAYEVAKALAVPLDIFLVRKLGVPYQPELAMGAIASGGICHLNTHMIQECRVEAMALESVIQQEQKELERREQTYRQNRPFPSIEHRQIILVDDGIATGASMRAALLALRNLHPQKLIVATPVAPRSSLQPLAAIVDETICLLCPDKFDSVGQWYLDFRQVSDAEVCQLLQQPTQGG